MFSIANCVMLNKNYFIGNFFFFATMTNFIKLKGKINKI